ncbi:MAG: hypothetical protein V8S84_14565 [Lachnospiraceae bacterium]
MGTEKKKRNRKQRGARGQRRKDPEGRKAGAGMAGNIPAAWQSAASPDIIGVTSGASVAAVFGILVLKLPGRLFHCLQ